MDKTLKINRIESVIQKGSFGNGKYYGYKKYKVISLVKISTNKKIHGIGESLVGVYSPRLFSINLKFISKLLINKNIKQSLDILKNLQKNKFFFDAGVLKSIIASIEIGLFDIMAQSNNQTLSDCFSEFFNEKIIEKKVPVYASAGSILGSINDLRNEVSFAKKKGFNIFKARISLTNFNYKKKLNFLKNNINHFSIDLISNTYEKNSNLSLVKKLISNLKTYEPLWIEEILSLENLYKFKIIKNKEFKFSYGENFNSISDFINLINLYKFDYINPDISHLTITDIHRLIEFLKINNLKKKIIFHCWGGNVNLYNTLSLATIFKKYVKLVEFPITDFDLNNSFLNSSEIINSKYYFDNKISKNQDLISINSFVRKNYKDFAFNF